jgi:hypothetical protein
MSKLSKKVATRLKKCTSLEEQYGLFFSLQAVSSGEAAWILQGFDVNYFFPSVMILNLHLEGHDRLTFDVDDGIDATLQKSTSNLVKYFRRPLHPEFNDLTYEQYFAAYLIGARRTTAAPVTDLNGNNIYARTTPFVAVIQSVHPHNIELFALRRILSRHPARSFEHARFGCSTFTLAARNLGLLANEEQDIDGLLVKEGRRLHEFFHRLPIANCLSAHLLPHQLVVASYFNRPSMTFTANLNQQQEKAYCTTIAALSSGSQVFFYINGSAGTGKTFLLNTIISSISNRMKVLTTAYTGIAAGEVLGAVTCHALLRLPTEDTDERIALRSYISQSSFQAELFRTAQALVIDEVSMIHNSHFDVFDITARELRSNDLHLHSAGYLSSLRVTLSRREMPTRMSAISNM